MGIPPRWARQVLLCQHAALIAGSTLRGLVIAVLPTVVIAARISGFVLSVPWWQLAVLAAVHPAHRLRVTEARSA
ncbi:hypothetical protein ABT373_38625 [Streptomyces sp. NPDC000070]|uniref:hypothetical protein n=1 Tax=Streptomyces sp. NPDC000070 TaxID=3154240 RepID=UPI003329C091